MWWRVVRIFTYVTCGAVIVMFVVAQSYICAVFVKLNAHSIAGVGVHSGNVVVFRIDNPSSGSAAASSRLDFDAVPSEGLDRNPAWLPVIEPFETSGYGIGTGFALSIADVYPLTLAILGLALTCFFTWRARLRIRPGHCACGYDLRGNPTATTCPECGAAIDRPVAAPTSDA